MREVTMDRFKVPLIIRGNIIWDPPITFETRRGGATIETADVEPYLDQIGLATPSRMREMYDLSFDEIIAYLSELGDRLHLDRNVHMQEALKLSIQTSGLGKDILERCYREIPGLMRPAIVYEMVDKTVGIPFLEGWVPVQLEDGSKTEIRAIGARTIHIAAGNVPTVSAITIIRNAVLRSDAIIKTPSNDPLTAVAIARTMIEMAPDHPLTKHLSVAYWKGGTESIERRLYRPDVIEKIIAWGGKASIEHIAQYIQPGIDLITMDPKLSSTIIGGVALKDENAIRETARRLALDVGGYNQEGCVNARVVYAECGTDAAGLAKAERLGSLLWEEIRKLPSEISCAADAIDARLDHEIEALRQGSDWHSVIGGGLEGAVIVSHLDEPVEFARLLCGRVANIVPIDDLEIAIKAVTAYTQTIGIYPDALKVDLRDRLALQGAQRIVTLGNATVPILAGPHDGVEPLRRMCKWVSDEHIQDKPTVVA
jgi:hypothetical protein